MPITIKLPVEKEFILEQSDKILECEGEPTKASFRVAREGEHMKRMELWRDFTRNITPDGEIQISQSVSPAEIQCKEVFLTMTACNVLAADNELLFRFPLVESKFRLAWASLPTIVADELHAFALEMNPLWAFGEEL